MARIILYLLIVGTISWLIYRLLASKQPASKLPKSASKWLNRFRRSGGEPWVQVYDSDSADEIKKLQAHLEEEEIDCFVYEQGRKDVHGHELKRYGLSVPKSAVSQAQKIITKTVA